MPKISSPRPLDLTKPFVLLDQSYGSYPTDLSKNLVTWYRDIQGDFVPDLSGRGNTARAGGFQNHPRVTGSIDTPEFNPLNEDLRSFDFNFDASTATSVDNISTIDDNGSFKAKDDHSFTDGTKDTSFSISFWTKISAVGITQRVVTKATTSAGFFEWGIDINSSDKMVITLGSQGSSANYLEQITDASIVSGVNSGWNHFIVTHDGKKNVKIYKNGVELSSTKNEVSYVSMKKTSMPLCLGSRFASTLLNTFTASDFCGKLYSFAIWKNQALSSAEISSLYSAYRSGVGGTPKGGFISRSPRLHLRELDDLPGSYPTVRRTGDPTRTGALTSNFNDGTSIVFSQSGNVVFPTMLPKGSSFASQAVDIIGQESDISASLPIRSFQQPNYLHYSPTESVGPFNENRTMPATAFFLSGTDPSVAPGFSEPARSKIQLTKLLVNSSEFQLGVGSISRGNSVNRSAVAYVNFSSSKFEYKGLNDPATGASIAFDIAANVESKVDGLDTYYRSTGSDSMVQMFVRPENQYDTPFYDDAGAAAYVGYPTIAAFAPVSNKYYATSSQLLRMSDFIQNPFMLEKISIEITNVQVQRPANSVDADYDFSSLGGRAYGVSSKLQDNYVFFLGRQFVGRRDGLSGYRNDGILDAEWAVSSSVREVFATASACFYNLPTYHTFSDMSGPSHSPVFSHDFNKSIAVSRFILPCGAISNGDIFYLIFGSDSGGPLIAGVNFVVGAPGTTATNLYNAINANTSYVAALASSGYLMTLVGDTILFTATTPFSSEVTDNGTGGAQVLFGSTGGTGVSAYTGSINLEFCPTVSPLLPNMGLRSIPNEDLIARPKILSTDKITLQLDAWPGGNSLQDIQFNKSNYVLTGSGFDYTIMGEFPTGSLSSRSSGSFFASTVTVDSPLLLNENAVQNDPSGRSFRKFGGENVGSFMISPSSSADAIFTYRDVSEPSTVSPYILMPEDKIFMGVDAGISVYHGMSSFSRFDETFMRFTSGSTIKITLFGSEIKSGVSNVNALNQNLNSLSVHEIIGAEPVLDQFMIEPRSSYYGSYLDDIVTGSMAILNPDGITFTIYDQDNSRRVIGRTST